MPSALYRLLHGKPWKSVLYVDQSMIILSLGYKVCKVKVSRCKVQLYTVLYPGFPKKREKWVSERYRETVGGMLIWS